jgi:hypothetical protein
LELRRGQRREPAPPGITVSPDALWVAWVTGAQSRVVRVATLVPPRRPERDFPGSSTPGYAPRPLSGSGEGCQ